MGSTHKQLGLPNEGHSEKTNIPFHDECHCSFSFKMFLCLIPLFTYLFIIFIYVHIIFLLLIFSLLFINDSGHEHTVMTSTWGEI